MFYYRWVSDSPPSPKINFKGLMIFCAALSKNCKRGQNSHFSRVLLAVLFWKSEKFLFKVFHTYSTLKMLTKVCLIIRKMAYRMLFTGFVEFVDIFALWFLFLFCVQTELIAFWCFDFIFLSSQTKVHLLGKWKGFIYKHYFYKLKPFKFKHKEF